MNHEIIPGKPRSLSSAPDKHKPNGQHGVRLPAHLGCACGEWFLPPCPPEAVSLPLPCRLIRVKMLFQSGMDGARGGQDLCSPASRWTLESAFLQVSPCALLWFWGLTEDKRDHQHPREPGVNLRGLLSVELLTCWAFSQLPSVLSVETPKNAAPPSSTRNPPMQLRVTGTPPPGLLPPPSPHLSTHCAGLSRAEANTGPQRGPHSHPWITGAGRELPWLSLGFPRVQTLEMLRPASPMTLSSVLQNCWHWC